MADRFDELAAQTGSVPVMSGFAPAVKLHEKEGLFLFGAYLGPRQAGKDPDKFTVHRFRLVETDARVVGRDSQKKEVPVQAGPRTEVEVSLGADAERALAQLMPETSVLIRYKGKKWKETKYGRKQANDYEIRVLPRGVEDMNDDVPF